MYRRKVDIDTGTVSTKSFRDSHLLGGGCIFIALDPPTSNDVAIKAARNEQIQGRGAHTSSLFVSEKMAEQHATASC